MLTTDQEVAGAGGEGEVDILEAGGAVGEGEGEVLGGDVGGGHFYVFDFGVGIVLEWCFGENDCRVVDCGG
jgi:hypothetical protein